MLSQRIKEDLRELRLTASVDRYGITCWGWVRNNFVPHPYKPKDKYRPFFKGFEQIKPNKKVTLDFRKHLEKVRRGKAG